jgi:hypothetical protein
MIARFLRDNGLTIVLLAAFFGSTIGMTVAGLSYENQQLREHASAPLTLLAYLGSAAFQSALFENWESEFLQMGAYVMLTAMLFQRGSAESRDPDEPFRPDDELPKAVATWRKFGRWLYAHGLGLALAALFVLSFVLHWLASVTAANDEALRHGGSTQSAFHYLGSAQLWFESFQNWQSEFLATAVLVVLSIFLRFKGSPESKALKDAHGDTGA